MRLVFFEAGIDTESTCFSIQRALVLPYEIDTESTGFAIWSRWVHDSEESMLILSGQDGPVALLSPYSSGPSLNVWMLKSLLNIIILDAGPLIV